MISFDICHEWSIHLTTYISRISLFNFAVGGGFGEWSDWSACSVTCGGGEMFKRRTCDNPAPSNGGASCDGIAVSSVQCNTVKCPGLCFFFPRNIVHFSEL